ncbi:MAG TPA: hypothetical protein PKC87_04275, partial [Candidatus Absconditabacterales bacterium]|nr:hypothetical protein [Candidatus Absconditabacterales bacterium]
FSVLLIVSNLPAANAKRLTIAAEQATIAGQLGTIGTMLGNIVPRQGEYQNLANIVNEFDIPRLLPDMRGNTYNVGPDFMTPGATADGFNFYNEAGTIINLANYWIDIKLADNTIQNVRINGLVPMTVPNGTIDLTGITFTDRTGNPYVPTQGYEFILHPGAIRRTVGGREFINNKELKVIRGPVGTLNTQALRETEVDAYNNAGTGNVIGNAMDRLSGTNLAKREREAIFRAISNKDGPKFDKLSAEQKEDMYQNVRRLINPPTGVSPLIPGANFMYNGFRTWVTADRHPGNIPENIINPMAFRNYINNNLETLIPQFFARQMDVAFIDDITTNTLLKSEVTRYLSEIENQKLDNNVHQDIMGDIDTVDMMENRRSHNIIGRRDVNYLRFFSGQDSKTEIKDQTVNITTNDRPEDLNNPEPVKYDMNLEVSGKQQILVNIKIDKQKEIKLKAGDPAAMVRTILQCEAIQYGKVRAHVVYNVMKGFIDSAKKKDISLTYRDPATGDMIVIRMDEKNIVLEQQDNQTNFGGTHRRNTTVLFDHQLFENTNTFDSATGNANRRLRIGIDRMMGHFNFAMNELHDQYRQASERRWMGLRRGETRMTLPTSFWLSPIKKMMNFRTTTKFDFSTNVQSNGKTISIDFKKNVFSLNVEGLKKPISGRTLGKILRFRQGGVRLFDGMERDICGKIYEELINKMRENTKIARTNFGVRDCITGRTYILDSDGQLGYISAEQAAINPNMIRRGIVSHREYGIVDNPPAGRTMCDESETREVMKNPFLMGRLIKTMNNRMGVVSSTRALLN